MEQFLLRREAMPRFPAIALAAGFKKEEKGG